MDRDKMLFEIKSYAMKFLATSNNGIMSDNLDYKLVYRELYKLGEFILDNKDKIRESDLSNIVRVFSLIDETQYSIESTGIVRDALDRLSAILSQMYGYSVKIDPSVSTENVSINEEEVPHDAIEKSENDKVVDLTSIILKREMETLNSAFEECQRNYTMNRSRVASWNGREDFYYSGICKWYDQANAQLQGERSINGIETTDLIRRATNLANGLSLVMQSKSLEIFEERSHNLEIHISAIEDEYGERIKKI